MEVLVYVLPTAPPLPGDSAHYETNQISLGWRKTEEGDEEHLQLFSKILLNVDKEATFDALGRRLPFRWSEWDVYDTVNPFGDRRDIQFHALWTFDIQNDVLRYTNHNSCSQIPLSLLRDRDVSLADMESLGGPVSLPMEPKFDSGLRNWRPRLNIDDRLRAFTHRLLRGFHYQWRHILRNSYKSMTLRVLARAIIRLSTLEFEVRFNTGGGSHGAYVWITDLPAWEPFETDVVRVGNIYVVLCHEIQKGLSIAQHHVLSRRAINTGGSNAANSGESQAHYMILSVKHIMLCHANDNNSLEYTAPEPLFNTDYGAGTPSDLALDYLIWATASARPLMATPLQLLPIEIQDIIMSYVSPSTVEAAKVGCLLGLGSPFLWKDGDRKVTLEERYTNHPPGTCVESQIWFGECKSGMVYLLRTR